MLTRFLSHYIERMRTLSKGGGRFTTRLLSEFHRRLISMPVISPPADLRKELNVEDRDHFQITGSPRLRLHKTAHLVLGEHYSQECLLLEKLYFHFDSYASQEDWRRGILDCLTHAYPHWEKEIYHIERRWIRIYRVEEFYFQIFTYEIASSRTAQEIRGF